MISEKGDYRGFINKVKLLKMELHEYKSGDKTLRELIKNNLNRIH